MALGHQDEVFVIAGGVARGIVGIDEAEGVGRMEMFLGPGEIVGEDEVTGEGDPGFDLGHGALVIIEAGDAVDLVGAGVGDVIAAPDVEGDGARFGQGGGGRQSRWAQGLAEAEVGADLGGHGLEVAGALPIALEKEVGARFEDFGVEGLAVLDDLAHGGADCSTSRRQLKFGGAGLAGFDLEVIEEVGAGVVGEAGEIEAEAGVVLQGHGATGGVLEELVAEASDDGDDDQSIMVRGGRSFEDFISSLIPFS